MKYVKAWRSQNNQLIFGQHPTGVDNLNRGKPSIIAQSEVSRQLAVMPAEMKKKTGSPNNDRLYEKQPILQLAWQSS